MHSCHLLFLDIGGGELLLILIVTFMVFGPKRMPEIARKLGRTMNELKKASADVTREFREETNSIKNELLSARETVRRESESIQKAISGPVEEAGKTLAKEINEPVSGTMKTNAASPLPPESKDAAGDD